MLTKARNLGKKWHDGQKRKFCDEPYFNHCERVFHLVSLFTDNEDILIASLLHDTIEDCSVQSEQLEYEFNLVVAAMVTELTNQYTKKAYPHMKRSERKKNEAIRIGRISKSSKIVKLADRIDNVLSFKKDCDPRDYDYYIKESRELLEVLRGTHPTLEAILATELGVN